MSASFCDDAHTARGQGRDLHLESLPGSLVLIADLLTERGRHRIGIQLSVADDSERQVTKRGNWLGLRGIDTELIQVPELRFLQDEEVPVA